MSLVNFNLKTAAAIAAVKEGGPYKAARRAWGGAVKENVERIAPRGQSGEYHESLEVDDDGSVGTTDPFGHLVEWGSVNNRAYAPIRQGVRDAGLALHEESRGE